MVQEGPGSRQGPIESRYAPSDLILASRKRRLGAHIIDIGIESMTLGVGWLIWFAFVAPRGQSPGKQLLRLYIIQQDGTRSGGGDTWVREYFVKRVLFGLVFSLLSLPVLFVLLLVLLLPLLLLPTSLFESITSSVSVPPLKAVFYLPPPFHNAFYGYFHPAHAIPYFITALPAAWLLLDTERQSLWDKAAKTYVAHSPSGFRPRTTDELKRERPEGTRPET
jgi:uncharacterized RDD family membrane protein YckC